MKTILLIIFLKNNDLEIYRIYMTIFFLAYFGVVIGMRSIMLYKETKVDATKDFGKNSETKKAERIIQFALLIMIVIAANYILILENYKYLFPFKELEIGWLQTTGFVMSLIGLVFTFIAQIQMKNSWRLGIDKNEDVELITKGLFTLSRNPIYLGLGVSFVGFFLLHQMC